MFNLLRMVKMKKILIITSSFDFTADYIINKYKAVTLFYRFNTDLFNEYEIIIDEKSGWIINNRFWTLKEEDVYSIYYRKPTLPKLEEYDSIYHGMMYREMITIINGIVEVFKGRCLTKPSKLRNAENKVYQLSIARQLGFKLPKSLITNSPDAAKKFNDSNKSIVKPISIGKINTKNNIEYIQTNIVNDDFNIEDIVLSPAYFQEYVNKDFEVRVTVINDMFYNVKIVSSDKIDWRKTNSKNIYENMELPKEIKEKCNKMLKIMKIDFGAFDFIVYNNEYFFLEVNPNGQWYWLEEALKLNISDSIHKYLVGEI